MFLRHAILSRIFSQKDSQYLGMFNYNMIKMHESGILEALKRKWVYKEKLVDACSCREITDQVRFASIAFPALFV